MYNRSTFPVEFHRDLFNIVINDLPSATKNVDFVMYADDTTLVSTLKTFGRTCNVKEIERNINIEISKVTTWLQGNSYSCMSLN